MILDQIPGEDDKTFWKRFSEHHNNFARVFNKNWFNKLTRNKIPLCPSWKEL